jgi:hypothetical protein
MLTAPAVWGHYYVSTNMVSRSRFLCPACVAERRILDPSVDLIEAYDPMIPPPHSDCEDCGNFAPLEVVPL